MTEQSFTLSNRMYNVLRRFVGRQYSLDQLLAMDQRPVRALVLRGYLDWIPSQEAFSLTRLGEAHWLRFQRTDIFRKDPKAPAALAVQQRMRRRRHESSSAAA